MSLHPPASSPSAPRTRALATAALVATVGVSSLTVAAPADAARSRAPRITYVSAQANAAAVAWTRSAGAHHYRVRLADNARMRSARTMTVNGIEVHLSHLAAGHRYYVKVQAVRSSGRRLTAYGPARKVRTKPVTSPVTVVPKPTPTPSPSPVVTTGPVVTPGPVSNPAPSPTTTPEPTPTTAPATSPSPVATPTPVSTPTSAPTPVLTPSAAIPLAGWDTPLGASAPLETDPSKNGTAMGGVSYARRLANQAQYTKTSSPVASYYDQGYATIVDAGSAPVYTVPASQATRSVTWVTGSGDAPYDWAAGLQSKLDNVPVPSGPNGQRFEDYYGRSIDAGSGADHQFVIYKPSTGEMWEFWDFRWNAAKNRYECGYAGYSPDSSKGSMTLPNNWGARATSLPLLGGIMLQSEYAAGSFNHPLEVALPVVKSGFLAPATRQDGGIWPAVPSGDARDGVPEGAWFRLPADYQIDTTKPKLWQMMVKAARDYGIIVADQTGGTVTFSAEAPNAVGTPYSSLKTPAFPTQTTDSNGPFWGKTGVLNTFPWKDLVQVAPPS